MSLVLLVLLSGLPASGVFIWELVLELVPTSLSHSVVENTRQAGSVQSGDVGAGEGRPVLRWLEVKGWLPLLLLRLLLRLLLV